MIKAIGRYLPQDASGLLLNDCDWSKVPEHWKEVLTLVKNAYQYHLSEKLHSVYLRGSVAAGLMIDGSSDLDTFALVYDDNIRWQSLKWKKSLEAHLRKQFSFVREVEVVQSGINDRGQLVHSHLQPILKLQSLCLWGENMIPSMPDFRPGPLLARNYRWLKEDVQALRQAENLSEEAIKSILKSLLRSGFEWVMEREGRFTTDLYPCYQSFSKYYPEWEAEMRQVLTYYLKLPTEKKCLLEIADGLGEQLIKWFSDWP